MEVCKLQWISNTIPHLSPPLAILAQFQLGICEILCEWFSQRHMFHCFTEWHFLTEKSCERWLKQMTEMHTFQRNASIEWWFTMEGCKKKHMLRLSKFQFEGSWWFFHESSGVRVRGMFAILPLKWSLGCSSKYILSVPITTYLTPQTAILWLVWRSSLFVVNLEAFRGGAFFATIHTPFLWVS